MKQSFPIQWMHCASCAKIITDKVSKLDWIESCEVNFVNKKAIISYDEQSIQPEDIAQEIVKYGYGMTIASDDNKSNTNTQTNSEDPELKEAWNKVVISLPITIISVWIMIRMIGAEYNRRENNQIISVFLHHLLPIFATVMLTVIGWKYVIAIGRYIRFGVANMDTLVGIGTVTAFLYSFILTSFETSLSPYIDVTRTFYEAVIVVIGFIEIGKYMELKVMSKTWQAIKALIGLQAKVALILRDNKEIKVALDQVHIGDIMIIKPGEKIPLDGTLIKWSTFIDESMISWEPIPVQKKEGDLLIGATIVKDSTIFVQATAIGADTYLSKIIAIVEQAQNSKPSIQRLADRIMKYFIPSIILIAIGSWLFWLFLGKQFFPDINAIQFAVMSFVGVLVIACPCWLGLATPMAIITWVGHGAKNGILAKNAEWLLKLRKSKLVVFDKTGTLTEGKPKLIDIEQDSDYSFSILASLESLSSHPIAHAITEYAKENDIALIDIHEFRNIEGVGIQWIISGILYTVSKPSYVQESNLLYDIKRIEQRTKEGKTPLILSTPDKVIGYYAVADSIKESSFDAIKQLISLWITPVMLTWDHINTAQYIAWQLGITRIYANVKPDEKANIITDLKHEWMVTMVGDGINDAPALATADIGVAMSTWTDVAIESAELTLLHGDLSKLVKAIHISKLTHSAIIQNLAWAFGFNIIGIPLAAGAFYPLFGILLNPAFEGAAMAFSDFTVVGNSLRLQAKKI